MGNALGGQQDGGHSAAQKWMQIVAQMIVAGPCIAVGIIGAVGGGGGATAGTICGPPYPQHWSEQAGAHS